MWFSTKQSGFANYMFYRLGAEMISAAIAMGLHQRIKADRDAPFFLCELRKNIRARIYGEEVSTAVLLGRPLRVFYRHWNLESPLDLTNSELLLQMPLKLNSTIAALDADGYNRHGEIRYVTWLRMDVAWARMKEEIMDPALGELSREEVLDRAKLIQEKVDQHLESLPGFMTGPRRGPANGQKESGREALDTLLRTIPKYSNQSIKILLQPGSYSSDWNRLSGSNSGCTTGIANAHGYRRE